MSKLRMDQVTLLMTSSEAGLVYGAVADLIHDIFNSEPGDWNDREHAAAKSLRDEVLPVLQFYKEQEGL